MQDSRPNAFNDAANDLRWVAHRCRTAPIPGTSRGVPGYPDKLRVYLTDASPFWQVRCFFQGRMRTRSLRTSDSRQALRGARTFYEELAATGIVVRAPRRAQGAQAAGTFSTVAEQMLASERSRRGEFSAGSLELLESQLRREIFPLFGACDVASIGYPVVERFVRDLSERGLSPTTIHHYLIAIRKVLRHAVSLEQLAALPAMPVVKLKASPRGGFTLPEYRHLVREARRADRSPPRTRAVAREPALALLIRFMVNSFVRPHDVKLLQYKHVEVVRAARPYLRLRLPETKRKTAPVVTMPAAVGVYEALLKRARAAGRGAREDYLFLPAIANRAHAMWRLDQQFRALLEASGLRIGALGRARTLYSLRHTAIMLRLLYGKGIDLLALARNARTSVAMIERFYASNLTAEMNIDILHSRRARRG